MCIRDRNEVYVKFITTGCPFVIVKTAVTADGKTATRTGRSRWISGEKARGFVHRLRHNSDAIAVGIETVLRDDPRLTALSLIHICPADTTSLAPPR